jgi:hypothetical protein
MFPLNTIIAWSINIIMNKKYDNNNIIIASRAYFLQATPAVALPAETPPGPVPGPPSPAYSSRACYDGVGVLGTMEE